MNITFSPAHIIKKLDEGEELEEAKKEDNKAQEKGKQADQKADNSRPKLKKANKKNKKNAKGKTTDANGVEAKEDQKLFEISYLHNKNFRNLLEDNRNAKYFKLKPKEFYSKIVKLVKKRFDYDLDPELTNLQ